VVVDLLALFQILGRKYWRVLDNILAGVLFIMKLQRSIQCSIVPQNSFSPLCKVIDCFSPGKILYIIRLQ